MFLDVYLFGGGVGFAFLVLVCFCFVNLFVLCGVWFRVF